VFPELNEQVVNTIFNQGTVGSKMGTVMVKGLNIILVQLGKRIFITFAKQIP
jgi:hypothetical protein